MGKNNFYRLCIFLLIFSVIIFFIYKNQTEKKIIEEIDYKVHYINSYENSSVSKLLNDEFMDHPTDGGGSLSGYYKEGKIDKIIASIGLSYGNITTTYYFSNNEIIFIHQSEEYFPPTTDNLGLDYQQLILGFQGNYYFNKNKIIKSSTFGQRRFLGAIDFIDLEQTYLIDSKRYMEILNKKIHHMNTEIKPK